jgi:hypothetical protein
MFAAIVNLESWLYKSNVCATAGSRKPTVAVTNEPTNDIIFPSCGTLAATPATNERNENRYKTMCTSIFSIIKETFLCFTTVYIQRGIKLPPLKHKVI